MPLRLWMVRLASVFLVFGVFLSFTPPAQAASCGLAEFNLNGVGPNPYFRSSGLPLNANISFAAVDTSFTPLPATISTSFFDLNGRFLGSTTSGTIPSSFDRQIVAILNPPVFLAAGTYNIRVTANAGVCGSFTDGFNRVIVI